MALIVLGQFPGTRTVTPRLWRINEPMTRMWRKLLQSVRVHSWDRLYQGGDFGYRQNIGCSIWRHALVKMAYERDSQNIKPM